VFQYESLPLADLLIHGWTKPAIPVPGRRFFSNLRHAALGAMARPFMDARTERL